jgi:PAS domain S-box-containing protein
MSSQQHDRDLNRKLLTISSCNQALLRANDEAALLNEICRIICSHTQYRMAWVGYVEHDETYSVTPQAWAGAEDGFLSQSGLTWADSEEAHRPLWKAIRSGKTSYVQDLSNNAESAHWVKYAHDRGYRSTIALPLQNEKEITFAVLCIYSTQTQAFTSDEIKLLEELAANLAYGINSLRIRAERKLAEEALMASEQLFRTMIENSPDFISRYDNQLRRVYINPALQKMFDQPVTELLGTTPAVASPLHDHQRYMAAIKSVIETASECAEELSFRTPDGGTR